jgi:parallel beta-helix repeat protein
VDGSSASCSSSGPGTEAQPYCTISAALAARGGPGVTILVKPGNYREQVTVPVSGTSGAPLVIQALGSPVVIDGADDFSSTALWTLYSGDVWRASSVTWTPLQAFADGARLTPSTASPASLPPRSFRYVSGAGLYVNAGGGNPGTHAALVGHRTSGIVLSGRSWVTIDGIAVTRTEDKAIVLGSSNDITLTRIVESFANKYGIQATGCARVRIAACMTTDNNYHGMVLTSGTTGCTIEDNESARNALPSQRAANGIYLYGASSNLVRRNRWHDNQDTGQHFQSGSNNNVSYNNLSWNNGDHGYDHLEATGTRHVGDVAFGNYKDGFSIEGNATGTVLHDCIAVDNGLTTNEFDLWVDSGSTQGFVSDDNLFWNSTSQPPVKYISTLYSSVADYSAASGQDTRTVQANPRFMDPAHGNFYLQAGSPAIDNGNSSVASWPATDAAGQPRADDPATPNTGIGPVAFADRGAFEYQPSGSANQAPVAALTVTPASGTEPLAVTADASGSSDPDGSVASYRFDFGDGTVVGPQPGATATHSYAAGNWTATVTVTDNGGATGSTSTPVAVSPASSNLPPVATLAVTPASGTEPLAVTADASGSSDPDGTIASYRFDFGDGTVVGPQPGATATHTYAAGNWTATVTVTDNLGATGSKSTAVAVSPVPSNQPPVAALTVTPTLGTEPLAVTADASGSSDPDGTIASYRFDFGDGTVVGPQPGATATHSYAAGNWTATVTVTDDAGATASASMPVNVSPPLGTNLVGNPSFETNTSGWAAYAGSALLRVSGGQDGLWSLQVTASKGKKAFGVDDSPNWIAATPAAGTRYRFSAWVMSPTSRGIARLQVRELLNGGSVGGTVRSTGVTLSPAWQLLSVDFVTQATGSTLDFQVTDNPQLTGEVFQTDDIVIQIVSLPAASVALAAARSATGEASMAAVAEPPLRPVVAPSPMMSSARLSFTTSRSGPLRVEIFDVAGRQVRRLADDAEAPAGRHQFLLDGRDESGARLSAGLYLYRIRAAEGVRVGRFVVVR